MPAEGGVEEPLPLPRAFQGKLSPDGTRVAYRMNTSWDEERRNYKGGQNRPIWIVDLKTYDLVSPPWTDSWDKDPAWVGDTVYFISDRDDVANVWSFDTKTKRLAQVTTFRDFDVKALDANAGAVVFEQTGVIYLLDPKSGSARVVDITASGDFPWMVPQRTLAPVWSPDSKWVAYASRLTSLYRAICVTNVDTGDTKQVTDGIV